jgi:hypothetical protein
MSNLPNQTGAVGYGPSPGSFGDSQSSTDQILIAKANSVPIIHVLKHYGVRLDPYSNKAVCPFKSHKNGRESTASFKAYEDTNTFKCFGCGRGGKLTHFVCGMDSCNPENAARKILQLFATHADADLLTDDTNPSEKLELMVKFSSTVFDFRQSHNSEHSEHAEQFIEYICWVYDRANELHAYDNEGLRRLVEHCTDHIGIYSPELVLTCQQEYLDLQGKE